MVKQKIALPDIISLVEYFKKNYLDARLQQVYDINSKSFLLKFLLPTKEKKFVIVDANVQSLRIHETTHNFKRQKLPSSFCAKLRKHLPNKKITNIKQLGIDRIIDIQLGFDNKFHLILEMYDNGNLILTDDSYKILILSRRHVFNEESKTLVGHIYPHNQVTQAIQFNDELYSSVIKYLNTLNFPKKKSFREIFLTKDSPIGDFGKDIILNSLCKMGIAPNKKFRNDSMGEFDCNLFLIYLKETLANIGNSEKGYIFFKDGKPENYAPIFFEHLKNMEHKEYANMNLVLDDYYKPNIKEKQLDAKQETVKDEISKIDKIKLALETKIKKLNNEINQISKIIQYLEEEYVYKNCHKLPKINIIDENKKDRTTIYKFLLPNHDSNNPNNQENSEIIIEMKNEFNLWQNIKQYYQKQKVLKQTILKTRTSGNEAICILEKKEINKIKKKKYIEPSVPIKQFWFEKFKWFITSDGFLVILGRNKHQNEEIVSKYMVEGKDIYVHSDTHGSGSAIIKDIISNSTQEPSFRAVREAICFTVCNSKSWSSSITSDGYWVYPNQVSKTPQSGEYISSGSFIIRGKRNYITPDLVMGYTIVFKTEGTMILNNLVKQQDNIKTKTQNKIQWGIPMLAPYESIKKNLYVAKIVPGKGKLHKNAQKIKTMFLTMKEGTFLEKSFIYYIDNDLFINTMLNNSNIK